MVHLSDPPVLILTDARCLPGSEGGPVLNLNGDIVGLIAPELKRSDNSVVELSLVIPVQGNIIL